MDQLFDEKGTDKIGAISSILFVRVHIFFKLTTTASMAKTLAFLLMVGREIHTI